MLPWLRFWRALSWKAEFAFVMVGAFGYFFAGYFIALFLALFPEHPAESAESGALVAESNLLSLVIVEPMILAGLGSLLILRGWTLERIGLIPSWRDTAVGMGLAGAAYLLWLAIWSLLAPQPIADFASPGAFSMATIIAVSLVNPVFEELFLCGYVMTALQTQGRALTAMNVSIGVRLLLHLYQGAAGVAAIVPMGLLFSWFYSRSGRLWPLIVAHAVLDLVGLLPYVAR